MLESQDLTVSQSQETKIWNKRFISVFIANAFMYLSQWMVNSLVSKYADSLGAAASTVGMVASMFALSALIFKVVSGPAIDTFNRRIILMIAMFTMGVAYVGYSFSTNIPMLVVFRLLQGSGQAFTATCCLALAADMLPPDQFGTGIGIFSLAQAVMQAIGPSVGLTLYKYLGYNKTFMISAAVMMIAVYCASQVKVPYVRTRKFKISLGTIFAKEAILPAVIMFFLAMAFSVINSFLIIYAGKQGVEENIGMYFTVYACTLLFTRPLVGKLSDRFGMVKVVIPAMLCFAGSFLLISISSSLPTFLFAGFVAGFGYGACQPAVQTLCMKCVTDERRGAASSSNYIGTDAGQLLGPNIAGIIVVSFGYHAMWRCMTLFILAAMLVVIFFRREISNIESGFQSNEDCAKE